MEIFSHALCIPKCAAGLLQTLPFIYVIDKSLHCFIPLGTPLHQGYLWLHEHLARCARTVIGRQTKCCCLSHSKRNKHVSGLYLYTIYVYSLIYNLIKVYGPKIRNPHWTDALGLKYGPIKPVTGLALLWTSSKLKWKLRWRDKSSGIKRNTTLPSSQTSRSSSAPSVQPPGDRENPLEKYSHDLWHTHKVLTSPKLAINTHLLFSYSN